MAAWVVLDLGFGDAGKGLVVDALVRRTSARTVLRFNGGAQAGHNVVTPDGRHHTFSQVGAGAFLPGVRTLLGPEVVVHPTALRRELAVLRDKGVEADVDVHAAARLITPWHQALNHLRELARPRPHGSVGVGVGETVRDALAHPPLRAADLRAPSALAEKAEVVRKRLLPEALALSADGPAADAARATFAPDLAPRWAAMAAETPIRVVDGLSWRGDVVCEGAQGVLLDERFGFHPHTTWSDTTDHHARALVGAAERIGVIRVWPTRHGAGPFPSEDPDLRGVMVEHNSTHPWQGPVRVGHFDPTLTRYALDVLGGVDRLVVTHADALPRRPWRCVAPYELPPPGDLAHQEATGAWLGTLSIRLEPPSDALRTIPARLGRPIDHISRGNRATDLDLG